MLTIISKFTALNDGYILGLLSSHIFIKTLLKNLKINNDKEN